MAASSIRVPSDVDGALQGTPVYIRFTTAAKGSDPLLFLNADKAASIAVSILDAQTGAAAGSKLDDDPAPGHEMIADEPLSTAQTNGLLELFPDMCLDIDTALHSLHELGDVISDGLTICRRDSHIAFVRDHDGAPRSMASSIRARSTGRRV